MTQSNGVVKLVNELDHCIGYGEVHKHNMCWANQQLVTELIFIEYGCRKDDSLNYQNYSLLTTQISCIIFVVSISPLDISVKK